MRRMMAWTTGIAFLGGVCGPDAVGVLLTAFAAFVQAYAFRRAPWRWAVLAITAWAVGAGMGAFLNLLGANGANISAPPSQVGAGVTVLIAYASAFAGYSLSWAASRIARLP
jgi:hypothetical protein